MSNVVSLRVRQFVTDVTETKDVNAVGPSESNTILQVNEEDLSTHLTLQCSGQVILDLQGHTLSGTVTLVGSTAGGASVLVRGGTIRGRVVLGAASAELADVVCQNVCVIGSVKVRATGKALFDAIAISNPNNAKALDVEAEDRVVAHAINVKDVWLADTPSPQQAMVLRSQKAIEARAIRMQNIYSFAEKLQVLVLDGSEVRAANIDISEASAPRGVVEGVRPTATAAGGPVLADIRVQAHSGGEAAQLTLPTPEGLMVTATSGQGVTRPVVADSARTHGAMATVVRPEQE